MRNQATSHAVRDNVSPIADWPSTFAPFHQQRRAAHDFQRWKLGRAHSRQYFINQSEMTLSDTMLDTEPFSALVGEQIIQLIFEKAPTKVFTRIAKSLEHYTRAARLQGIDEEMGVIRLIAAEEELVVAIFEWIKLNAQHLPEHGDFIGKYKNHRVKLAFYPVLSQLGFVLDGMFSNGVSFEGLEDVLRWHVRAVRHEDKVTLQVTDNGGRKILDFNPLDLAITQDERTEQEVVDALFADLTETVMEQRSMTLREFVTSRADFRNKLLYAEDGATFSMEESLEYLIEKVFSPSLQALLWCLATLLTNKPTVRSWGLVSQFMHLYRKVLRECKL